MPRAIARASGDTPMLAQFTWRRGAFALAVFAGALLAASPNGADQVDGLTIRGEFKGRTVLLTATDRSAGAIESLQWGGTEFINASDQGRHLQSAVSYDGLTECDNPTEAGSRIDGVGAAVSSSKLEAASVDGNALQTRSQMAYWLRLGQKSAACGAAQNDLPTALSSTALEKTVRFLPSFENVLEHRISFEMARARKLAQFEVLTAYGPQRFASFYTCNPAGAVLRPLSDGPGEQALPVVLATTDGAHALGLYTPQAAAGTLRGPGYGRWRFQKERVTKSNVVFRLDDAAAGPHRFVVYSVFGTVDDVCRTIARLDGSADVAARAAAPVAAALAEVADNRD
jgi:hypothetical protein